MELAKGDARSEHWTWMDEGRIQVNSETAQVDDLQLIALPSAVNCTDLFVRFTLTEWSLRPLMDQASQVASQLAKAAVDCADPNSPGFITVRLRLRGDGLVIEVEDELPAKTSTAPPGLDVARSGVESLDSGGKLVWCELALPGGVNAAAVKLPQREKRRSPAAERLGDEPDEIDPQFMERLLSGLNSPPNGAPE